MERRRHYLFNYAFVGSLLLLVLNDHIFKAAFHNGLTGKLSDFAGMVVLPLLLAFLAPKIKTNAAWLSMLLFAFWKSPLSQPFIDVCNTIMPFEMGRVVDYTDLWAFLVVPLPYYIIKGNAAVYLLKLKNTMISPAFIVIPSLFVLIATTPPRGYLEKHYRPADGNINLRDKNISVKVEMNQEQILSHLDDLGVAYRSDERIWKPDSLSGMVQPDKATTRMLYSHASYYVVDRLVIDRDTLKDVQFYLHPLGLDPEKPKTKIYLNSLNIEKDLTDEKVRKKMTRVYKRMLKKYFNRMDRE